MDLLKKVISVLQDKKAVDIEVIKVQDITSLTDYMVICTGTSSTQIKALAGAIEEKVEDEFNLHHKEGYSSANWILLDYVDVVVSIFHPESRSFYNLDKIWSDGERISIEDIL